MAAEKKEAADVASKYPEPIIIEPKDKHTATVIWIHGLGDTGNGWHQEMLSLSKTLPYIKWILPTATKRAITCNNGAIMPGWYDIESTQNREINKYKGKDESMKYIHQLINNEIKVSKIKSDRIIIGGFSQGGAMSVYSGLLCENKIAAVICCSGYLLDFDNIDKKKVSGLVNKTTPIFMFHAKKDMVVPTNHAKKSYQHLKSNGCEIEWNEYNIPHNGGHSVTKQEMDDVQTKIITFLPK